jgi:hypothetical protein
MLLLLTEYHYNGNLSTPIGPAGNSNLIGNPYASALDANLFLAANSGVLEGLFTFGLIIRPFDWLQVLLLELLEQEC